MRHHRRAVACLTKISIVASMLAGVGTLHAAPAFAAAPNPGDVIVNEYASDNTTANNDFLELLVLTDGADLRGVRISDNELVGGVLNTNESVLVFGNDSYLASIPRGTTIAVWIGSDPVVTDTVTNPAAGDWSMTLAPGTGYSATVDGLGGSLNTGLSTGGEAIYVYLPGPDASSAGTDNVYLDFVSYETDGGDAPPGLADINLPAVADNAYFTGNTAAGADSAASWTRFDFPATNGPTTPGEANPGQDLSSLRSAGDAAPSVAATVPANAATLAPSANLSVTFTEPVNVAAGWFTITCPSGVRSTADAVVSGGPQSFVIDPLTDLVNGEACTLRVNAAQVSDVDAIDPPDTMAADLVASFTVGSGGGPNTAPTITPATVAALGLTLGEAAPATRTVTVADAETPVSGLAVSAQSSNAAVATAVVVGTGATRDIDVSAVGVGTATLTFTVTDGGGLTAQTTMLVGVSAAEAAGTFNHYGISDASTALDLGNGAMVVADDETNVLRIYERNASRLPAAAVDLVSLGLALPDAATREIDIEAVARSGSTLWWLGSHGQNSSGATRTNRQLLFTTAISGSGAATTFTLGGSYRSLRSDLIAWDVANGHGLGANALGLAAAAALAPEPNGFNIEGLEVAPDGTTLLIGFRSPLQGANGRALVVPVTNATALVTANPTTGTAAAFGQPMLLDLGGRGIRDLRRSATGDYVILAGPPGTGTDFRLYTWNGTASNTPVLRPADLADLVSDGSPESIVDVPNPLTGTSSLQIVTDSGDTVWYGNGVINKELAATELRKVRSSFVTLGSPPVCGTAPSHTIPQVQGSGTTAAVTGAVSVRGVVIGDYEGAAPAIRGFYVQDPTGDADSATSDGIFVFNANNDVVSIGDLVQVSGTAGEFQGQTQISATSVERCATGASVNPVDVTFPLATADALEAVEGMLVRFPQTLTVTEHFQLGRFGQVVLSNGGRQYQPTQLFAPGDPQRAAAQAAVALNRVILDDELQNQNPDPIRFGRNGSPLSAANTLRGGDTLTNATGVLTFTWAGNAASGNAYRLRPVNALGGAAAFVAANERPGAPPVVGGDIKVASFNLLNWFNSFGTAASGACTGGLGGTAVDCRGAENTTELERQAPKTVAAIRGLGADVVGLMELENDGYGPTSAIADLVNRLNAQDGPGAWAFIDADASTGVTNAAGTDAIKVGMIYRPARVAPVGGTTRSDTDAVFDRPPVAQTFLDTTGSRFSVVVNHFKSKGCTGATGADLDQGDGQSCFNARRTAQATKLASFITGTVVPAAGDPDVLVIGDLNSYAKEDPITVLANAGYVDLAQRTIGPSAYGYVFDGLWGTLDYALANASMAAQATGAGEHHINADEPSVLDYNTNFKSPGQVGSLYSPDAFRSSDHDPVVVGLSGAASVAVADVSVTEGTGANPQVTVTVTRTGGSVGFGVGFATAPGSAGDGTDFVGRSGALSFGTSDTTATIVIDVIGDALDEPDELFTVTLSAPTNGAVISQAAATVTILDDDEAPPTPRVDALSVSQRECLCIVSVPIRLTAVQPAAVSVRWRTVAGSAREGRDFAGATGVVQIPAGQLERPAQVLLLEDLVFEGDEAFRVEIVSADGGVTVGAAATVTIVDDETRPRVTVVPITVRETDRQQTVVMVVRMTGIASEAVTAAWSTADGTAVAGSDYRAASGTVRFEPGQLVKLISVSVIGDRVAEASEQFTIPLVVTGTADAGAVGTVTIRDDDR
jgi:predicted extracellular nuclease